MKLTWGLRKLKWDQELYEYVTLGKNPRTNWHWSRLNISGLPVLLVFLCKKLKWQFRSWNSTVEWRKAVSELIKLLGEDDPARHRSLPELLRKGPEGQWITDVVPTALLACWNWRTPCWGHYTLWFQYMEESTETDLEQPCVLAGFLVPRGSIQAAEGQLLRQSWSVLCCYILGRCMLQCYSGIVCLHTHTFWLRPHKWIFSLITLNQDKIMWCADHRP